MNNPLLKYFCRHLVVLLATYRVNSTSEKDSSQVFTCAGTVLLLGEQVLIMIAGHAAEDLMKLRDDPEYALLTLELADNFSDQAKDNHSIPLPISSHSIFAFNKGGLDFGFFLLNHIQARLLPKNGIVAIDESQWRNPISRPLDTYYVLGVPNEFVHWSAIEKSSLKLAASLVKLTHGEVLSEVEPGKMFRRFKGTLPSDIGMSSFKGMSGGPIFGMQKSQPDKYWIVAIQEAWTSNSRNIIYASPIHEIGGLVDRWLEGS